VILIRENLLKGSKMKTYETKQKAADMAHNLIDARSLESLYIAKGPHGWLISYIPLDDMENIRIERYSYTEFFTYDDRLAA
jgi:hypothetical protein